MLRCVARRENDYIYRRISSFCVFDSFTGYFLKGFYFKILPFEMKPKTTI